MNTFETLAPPNTEVCTGHCQGCGKVHVKVFGAQNADTQLFMERVQLALDANAIEGKVLKIIDPVAIQIHGVSNLPALMIEGDLVLQGFVPSVTEISRLMKNKDLFKSKLFHLHTLSVAVDMSEVSANALGFAWKIAQKMDCNLEIVYAMDSIFEGAVPSASGFLSSYSKTMQTELDAFIGDTMRPLGIEYNAPGRFSGEPGEINEPKNGAPKMVSKVIYGAPDVALIEYSRHTDLLVLGATGRNFAAGMSGGIAYVYDEDGTNRRENISDWALAEFQARVQPSPLAPLRGSLWDSGEGDVGHAQSQNLTPSPQSLTPITKWDIFHYIYAMLHAPDYRERYAANLRRELPRIPIVAADDFWRFVHAGRRLAEIHVNYEQQAEYPLTWRENPDAPLNWRVEKMRLNADKTSLRYNDFLSLDGIPTAAYDYKLGNRSALEWLIDQYRVSVDQRSGISNDPNRPDDPEYIVRLIGKIITVSLETVQIVANLPKLGDEVAR